MGTRSVFVLTVSLAVVYLGCKRRVRPLNEFLRVRVVAERQSNSVCVSTLRYDKCVWLFVRRTT